ASELYSRSLHDALPILSAAHFAGRTPVKEVWRVNADGELRDPFKKLTCVFQMSEEAFFRHYGKDKSDKHSLIDFCHKAFSEIYRSEEHTSELQSRFDLV